MPWSLASASSSARASRAAMARARAGSPGKAASMMSELVVLVTSVMPRSASLRPMVRRPVLPAAALVMSGFLPVVGAGFVVIVFSAAWGAGRPGRAWRCGR